MEQKRYDKFESEIFDCMNDTESCCEVTFCHHCQLSRQYNKLKYNKTDVDVEFCAMIFMMDLLLPGIGTIASTMKIRNTIQQKYNISEKDFVKDIIFTTFCAPFIICQNYREMSYRGDCPQGLFISQKYYSVKTHIIE